MRKYFTLLPLIILLISIQCSSEMDDTENLVIDEIATTEKIISNNTTHDNSNSNTSSNDELNSFDHTEMLTNWVDNIIIPSITNFDNSLEIFKESVTTFVNAPIAETLSNLKEALAV